MISRDMFANPVLAGRTGLGAQVQRKRITGICSQTPRSEWGAAIGPQLIEANQGLPLESAWEIDEMLEPPSETLVTGLLTASAAAFALVLVLALFLLWMSA